MCALVSCGSLVIVLQHLHLCTRYSCPPLCLRTAWIYDPRYIFPALLPRVGELPLWLTAAFGHRVTAVGRRFMCARTEDVVPPALVAMVLRRVVDAGSRLGGSPVFFGCGTAVVSVRGGFVAVHLTATDNAIDVVATGPCRHTLVHVVAAHSAAVACAHFSGLVMVKRRLLRSEEPPSEPHPFLGHCRIETVVTMRLEMKRRVPHTDPEWLASEYEHVVPSQPSGDNGRSGGDRLLALLDAASFSRRVRDNDTPKPWELLTDTWCVTETPDEPPEEPTAEPISIGTVRLQQAVLALNATVKATAPFVDAVFHQWHAAVVPGLGDIALHAPKVYVPPDAKPCGRDGHAPSTHPGCAKCQRRASSESLDPYAAVFCTRSFTGHKLQWDNSDAQRWALPDGHIEVAKLFCPRLGHGAGVTTAGELDGTALFNMLSWCTAFPPDYNGPAGVGQAAAQARNKIKHADHLTLTEDEYINVFEGLRKLLARLTLEGDVSIADGAHKALAKLVAWQLAHDHHSCFEYQRVVGESTP